MILNIWPTRPSGGPVRHGDPATGPARAHQFGRDVLGPWREHGADQAHHQIERPVLDGKHLRVAFLEACIDALGPGARSCLLDQVGGDVDAGHVHASARGRDRELTRAAGHIQHPRAGRDRETFQELQGARRPADVSSNPGFRLSPE
jgi:hypothetical protein